MKKLIIGALALGSLSSFAMSKCVTKPSDNFNTPRGSQNYEAKYTNDDGSISIIKPRFSTPEGDGNSYLSQLSDLNGVCNLYGLGNYVSNSRRNFNQGSSPSIVRINSNARFSQFDSSTYNSAIESLSCAPIEGMPYPTLVVSTGIFYNDDGSATIVKPKFKINGSNSYLSELSNLNGVCNLYGFRNYVSNSRRNFNQGSSPSIVRINSNARFSQFGSSTYNSAIESLICY